MATEKDHELVVRLRADADLVVSLFANGQPIGCEAFNVSNEFGRVIFPLDSSNWNESIQSVRIQLASSVDAFVEIDSIQVERRK